jgi:predicted AlkP superfamily phosphohydrolase/phosphomutase
MTAIPLDASLAISVPAWSSMKTGLDPGQLGSFGFRTRADQS